MARFGLTALFLVFLGCGDTALRMEDTADVGLPDGAVPSSTTSVVTDYPTVNWGGKVGQRFPNLSFPGVLSAATADTPATIRMADYFDPTGAKYDLLHVTIVAMWCPHCDNESTVLGTMGGWQAENRIAAVQIAVDGPNGSGPTMAEVAAWAKDHALTTPVAMDPASAQLKPYVKVLYFPLNLAINPRTMEIMDATTGEMADLKAYEKKFAAKVTGN